MTDGPPLRLAILGSGNIAATHAQAVAQIPGVLLTAVCSRNAEKAAQIAGPAQARVFTRIGDLLDAEVADAVLIATPSGAHAAGALPALRAGLHVLCEKPVEIHSDRIREMVSTADECGRILAGFFPLRGGAGAQTLREALDAGRFGRLTFLSARVKWWRDQDYYASSSWRGTWELDGGGALMNQGIHAVDLIQWFGGGVAEVTAQTATLAHEGIEVEDTLAASLRFANGALGTIAAATSCFPGLDVCVEVSGDAGTAILRNDMLEFWKFRDEAPGDEVARKNEAAGALGSGVSNPLVASCEGHRRQIEAFCRAIRGHEATLIDGREAGRAVAIIEAIYQSAKSGKSQPVHYLL